MNSANTRLGAIILAACAGIAASACGCGLFETGDAPPAESLNPDFERMFRDAAGSLAKTLESGGEEGAGEAACALRGTADSESGTPRRLAALFLAGEAFLRAGLPEEAHECFSEILDLDRDLSATESVLAGAGDSVAGLAARLSAREPGRGLQLFAHVIRRETEIAFRFLAGEKRPFLGLRIIGGRALASEILTRTLECAPYSPFAAQSLYELGNYHASEGEMETAIGVYERIIRDFPEDKWRAPAEYMAARCHFEINTDIDRDTSNLDRALMRFRLFLQNNQGLPPVRISAGVESDLVKLAEWHVERIRSMLAEKQYRIARYYAGKSRPQAARFYLTTLLKEYPGTEWAARAKEELAGEPDQPEAVTQ